MATVFKFKADGSGFTRGLEKMRGQVGKFSKSAGGSLLKVFAGGALIAGIKGFIDQMDRIGKLSKRLDVSVETIQRLGHAASLTGSSMEEIVNSITRLDRKVAGGGTATTAEALRKLGLEAEKFSSLSIEDKVIELSNSFLSAEERGVAFAALFTLLEDDAKKLIPLFEEGGDAIKEMFESSSVASAQTIKNMENINDAMTTFKNQAAGVASTAIDMFVNLSSALGDAVYQMTSLNLAFYRSLEILRGGGGDYITPEINDPDGKFGPKANTSEDDTATKKDGDAAEKMMQTRLDKYRTTQKKMAMAKVAYEKLGEDATAVEREKAWGKYQDLKKQAWDEYVNKLLDDVALAGKDNDKVISDKDEKDKKEKEGRDDAIANFESMKKTDITASSGVAASSLASIGGGGGAYAYNNDDALSEQKQTNALLDQMIEAIKAGSPDGGQPPL